MHRIERPPISTNSHGPFLGHAKGVLQSKTAQLRESPGELSRANRRPRSATGRWLARLLGRSAVEAISFEMMLNNGIVIGPRGAIERYLHIVAMLAAIPRRRCVVRRSARTSATSCASSRPRRASSIAGWSASSARSPTSRSASG